MSMGERWWALRLETHVPSCLFQTSFMEGSANCKVKRAHTHTTCTENRHVQLFKNVNNRRFCQSSAMSTHYREKWMLKWVSLQRSSWGWIPGVQSVQRMLWLLSRDFTPGKYYVFELTKWLAVNTMRSVFSQGGGFQISFHLMVNDSSP